jgi:N-acetyl-anhydromuramyl-L-alanine amidase AmpD
MNIIKPKYKWYADLKIRPRTEYIALHHSANKSCTAAEIHRWHIANGWAGIGYHIFITKEGAVYQGRPINTIGAQVANKNSSGIGVCVEGNYDIEQHMPEAQYRAVCEVLDYLKTLYPDARVVGHRDIGASACPGRYYPLEDFKAYWKGDFDMKQYAELKQELEALKAQQEKVYHYMNEIPEWGRATIEKLYTKGLFKGNSSTDLALTETMLKVFVVNDRAGLYD